MTGVSHVRSEEQEWQGVSRAPYIEGVSRKATATRFAPRPGYAAPHLILLIVRSHPEHVVHEVHEVGDDEAHEDADVGPQRAGQFEQGQRYGGDAAVYYGEDMNFARELEGE